MSMSNQNVVIPAQVHTWNPIWPWQYGGKKFTVTCGDCRHTWQAKLPVSTNMSALCPCCEAQNVWSMEIGRG